MIFRKTGAHFSGSCPGSGTAPTNTPVWSHDTPCPRWSLRAKRLPMNDNENLLEYLSANSTNRSRDAQCARVLLHHNATKRFAPGIRMIPKSGVRFSDKIMRKKEGGEAPKGACQPFRATPTNVAVCRCFGRGSAPLIGGAPAFRCYAAVLARANASAIGSAPVPAFPETRPDGRYPLRSVTSLPRSAETGLIAGRAVARSRPGAGCKPARRHRTRSASESALAKASLDERDSLM